MKKYRSIEELINNKNVIHVLSEARLPGEHDLFLELVESNRDIDVFKVYVAREDYVEGDNLRASKKSTFFRR